MSRRMSVLRGAPASRGRSEERMSAIAVRDLRDRLDRLGAPPRRPRLDKAFPRGFDPAPTPYGDVWLREDVLPLPALDPHPGAFAYIDTETTGLSGGAGTDAFAAAGARPIDRGLRLGQLFLPLPRLAAAVPRRRPREPW